MNKTRLWIVLAALAAAALACNAVTGATNTATPSPDGGVQTFPSETPSDDGAGDPNGNTSEYPAPDDAENFVVVEGTVNFQTNMSLEDVMDFYRDSFGKQGYTERTILTVNDETTFSMVFDGHSSGKAIVVQGVSLGASNNVTIRLEAVD
jgi:hypothetical protein